MIFIIGEVIKFNSEDGSITHDETHESIVLTLTASRLLEALLKSPHEIYYREQLLSRVWDDYGLQGSNSSLNQYISILRRSLATFGCENFIITVPKMGFRLNPDIALHLPSDSSHCEQKQDKFKKKSLLSKRFFILFAFISLLIYMLFSYSDHLRMKDSNHYSLYYDRLDNGCDVVFIKNLTKERKDRAKKYIEKIISDNAIICGSDKKIIFDQNGLFTSDRMQRTLFSICIKDINQQIVSCDNVYYHNWKPL